MAYCHFSFIIIASSRWMMVHLFIQCVFGLFVIFWCVYVVYTCVYIAGRGETNGCLSVWRSTSGIFLYLAPLYFSEAESLTDSARLTGQRDSFSISPLLALEKQAIMSSFLHGFWASKLWSSCRCSKHFFHEFAEHFPRGRGSSNEEDDKTKQTLFLIL